MKKISVKSKKYKQKIKTEMALMKRCNDVRIIRLYEAYYKRKEMYLILELMDTSLTKLT